MSAGAFPWLVANGTALGLLAVVLAGWAAARPRLRAPILVGAVGVVLVVVCSWIFPAASLETGWITVLQEGRSLRNIRQLYGATTHVGSGFRALTAALGVPGVETLQAVVHLNVCLGVANTVLFFAVASAVLGSWWGGFAFALGYACNLNTLHAAFSETPTMVWTAYFWSACIAAAVIDDDEAYASGGLRLMALLALTALAGLAALIRVEWLMLGVPAVVLGAVKVFGGVVWVKAAVAALGRGVRALVAGPLWRLLVVVAMLVGLEALPPAGPMSYVIEGSAPLNMSFLLLPLKLAIFLPVGFIVLFGLGMIYTTRHWLAFCLLPITLLTLFKSYSAAAQGNFEHFRYIGFVLPGVFFVALFGFRELSYWADRRAWPPWWRRVALLLVAFSMTAWQPRGPRELFWRRQQLPGVVDAAPLLALNQQTEVRYVLDLVRRYPECVFLVKAPVAESVGAPQAGVRWAAFGAPLPYVKEFRGTGGGLDAVIRELAPGAACVHFYRSLDCSLVDFEGCSAETEWRAAIEERVLENLPYSDIPSYGAHRPEIRLGVYPVAGAPG